MKKLLVVFTAILVVAFAAPVFAADATWTGEYWFSGITNFSEDDITSGWGYLYNDVTIDIDEYNDLILEFDAHVSADTQAFKGGDGDWNVTWAEYKTDVGMAAGLPIGLTASAGLLGVYSEKFEVTGHATERAKIRSQDYGQGFIFAADVGPATVKLGVNFELGPGTQDYALYAYYPGIADMVDVEAGYFIVNNDDFKGRFMASAKATGIMDLVSVAAGFAYDASKTNAAADAPADLTTQKWVWGVGVKADDLMDMIGVGVSAAGQEDEAFRNLNIEANVAFMDNLGLDLGVGLGFGDILDTFGGVDASVYYDAGKSTWRVGYLYQASDINNYAYQPAVTAEGYGTDVNGSGLYISLYSAF
jgi:hypothetical protein